MNLDIRPQKTVTAVGGIAELSVHRQRVAATLTETRAARESGELTRAADDAVKRFEDSLTGLPEKGADDSVTARVVAAAEKKTKLPAVPLEGLLARLKVGERVVAEAVTSVFGLVSLPLPDAGKGGSYELEVLAPDCTVMVCQTGRWTEKDRSPTHRIEVARGDRIKTQLERAKPLEQAVVGVRERAVIAKEAAVQALAEQETRLTAYLKEIDEGMPCKKEDSAEPVRPAVTRKEVKDASNNESEK